MSHKDKLRAERAEKLRLKQEEHLRRVEAEEQKKKKAEEEAKRKEEAPDEMTAKGYTISNVEIYSGQFGNVYKAKYKDEDIAVRIIVKEVQDKTFNERLIPRFVRILRALDERHPNIISTLDIFETSKRVLIMTRLTINSSLYDFLDNQTEPIDEVQCRNWAQQLISAVTYLHINGIVHRNMRTEHIIMDQKNCLKIKGFTYSRLWVNVNDNSTQLSNTCIGSGPYCAPETLKDEKYDPRTADVWAYGVIVFYIWNHSYPFDYNQTHILLSQHKSKEWIKRLRNDSTEDMKAFFNKIFDDNNNKRQPIVELIKDQWIDSKITVELGPQKTQTQKTINEDMKNNDNQKSVVKQNNTVSKPVERETKDGSDDEEVFDVEVTDDSDEQQTDQKVSNETKEKTSTKTKSNETIQKSDGNVLRADILDELKKEFRSLKANTV